MSVKLSDVKTCRIIPAKEMEDGQIGVITNWGIYNTKIYKGRIVQMYDDTLIIIGERSGERWSSAKVLPSDCKVRLLEPGECIQIVKN
jgi:hypothetical protein